MIEIEVQKYLRKKGLDSLKAEFKISDRRHQDLTNLVCLKYSQIESPMAAKIVQQCRGIILDEANDWAIVSYPYDKFFNYGEVHAAHVDWESAQLYEKLDGSLMTLYHYQDQWRVQSSGTADASGDVGGFKFTFAELFWQVWQEKQYILPTQTDHCFMFELCTKFNRIVDPHSENRLILHGVRNLSNNQEQDPSLPEYTNLNWEIVTTAPLKSADKLIEQSKKLDPMESEGYIVCDRDFQRIKIKSPQYVAISHLRDGFSPRRLLTIVVTNEGSEFLTYYPEWQEAYDSVQAKFEQLIAQIEADYEQYKDIEIQKDFALAIKHLPYCGVLFALRAGKTSCAREHLAKSTIQSLERLLGMENKDDFLT